MRASAASRSLYDARPSLSAAAVAAVTDNVELLAARLRVSDRSAASSTALSGFVL